MQRKSFSDMQCPIARGLEHVGEWWSILILRDAFRGLSRFDEFSESLGIAPNMLTRRLTALVEAGLMQRRRYNERPPRDEYVLTERGRDFRPAMLAMLAFGNRHFPPDDRTVQIVNTADGADCRSTPGRSGDWEAGRWSGLSGRHYHAAAESRIIRRLPGLGLGARPILNIVVDAQAAPLRLPIAKQLIERRGRRYDPSAVTKCCYLQNRC